jgi:hypothetical protein
MRGGEKQVKKAAVVVLAFALLMTFTASICAAHAESPMKIAGKSGQTGLAVLDEKEAGKNEIILGTGAGFFIGDIAGPFTSEARLTFHNAGLPNQWTQLHLVITISPAAVKGRTGTVVLMANGEVGGEGNWVIIGVTGGLTNLHGQGKFSSTGGFPQVAYEGQIHFDP